MEKYTNIEECITEYYRHKFRKATEFYKTLHFNGRIGNYPVYYINRNVIDRKAFKEIAELAREFTGCRFSKKPKLILCEVILYKVLDEVERRVTGTYYEFKNNDANFNGKKFHLS